MLVQSKGSLDEEVYDMLSAWLWARRLRRRLGRPSPDPARLLGQATSVI